MRNILQTKLGTPSAAMMNIYDDMRNENQEDAINYIKATADVDRRLAKRLVKDVKQLLEKDNTGS